MARILHFISALVSFMFLLLIIVLTRLGDSPAAMDAAQISIAFGVFALVIKSFEVGGGE